MDPRDGQARRRNAVDDGAAVNEPERIDLGEIEIKTDDGIAAELWLPDDDDDKPSGSPIIFSITDGGLAEAGFRYLGEIVGDGPTFEPMRRTEQ